ncbi:MAG: release factor glutamine methyltransferase [Planctomycetota bacterium]|jgi:release factor glutamine methyltransferase
MLAMARAFLDRKEIEEARLEAELLVAHALDLNRLGLFMALDRPLSGAEVDRARDFLVRRGKREPVAYIVGKREFYGRDFAVGSGVLIPRPETELIVDLVRSFWEESGGAEGFKIADLGSGSGCLSVTLALEVPASVVVASDISELAVARTQANAEALNVHVQVLRGDGAAVLLPHGPFDAFVSNPPYVLRSSAASLEPDVRDFEPELALYAPENEPDYWVAELIRLVPSLLRSGGQLFVELGFDQGERVLALAHGANLEARLHNDLDRIPRVLSVSAPLSTPLS